MNDRPRIFLLQMPPRGMNIKDAEQFGRFVGPILDVEPILSFEAGIADTMRKLRKGLKDYTSRDYLLPIGNPICIGLATSVATDSTQDGCVRFLKWEQGQSKYLDVLVNMED